MTTVCSVGKYTATLISYIYLSFKRLVLPRYILIYHDVPRAHYLEYSFIGILICMLKLIDLYEHRLLICMCNTYIQVLSYIPYKY